jgi:hypothetical protein
MAKSATANLLKENNEIISLLNVGDYVPDISVSKQKQYVVNPKSAFNHLPQHVIKTHDPYSYFYRNKKAIYIVRDGRDVLTSYYHYLNARSETPISIHDLIVGSVNEQIGTWAHHVLGWAKGKCKQKIIVRYEDFLTDPFSEIQNVLRFMEWDLDESKIRDAIDKSSFENLRQIEEKYGGVNDTRTASGKKTPFFRKGIANDWQNAFSKEDIGEFWKNSKVAMDSFDYS